MFELCRTALNWIRSYLDDRKSFILWGSGQSATSGSKIGVPQGSFLGPFLFSLYVSPLAKVTQSFGSHHHQYADDTYIFVIKEEWTTGIHTIKQSTDAL